MFYILWTMDKAFWKFDIDKFKLKWFVEMFSHFYQSMVYCVFMLAFLMKTSLSDGDFYDNVFYNRVFYGATNSWLLLICHLSFLHLDSYSTMTWQINIKSKWISKFVCILLSVRNTRSSLLSFSWVFLVTIWISFEIV